MRTVDKVRVEAWQMRELEGASGRVAAVVDGMHELRVGSRVFRAPLPLVPAQRKPGVES